MHDWIVIGAGFTGATVAQQLAEIYGQRVLVIDRRNQIGGNAHDFVNDDGHLQHTYGPHIFHTNSQRIWQFLSKFTEWSPYFHRVTGFVDGQYVPVPFNITSIERCFSPSRSLRIVNAMVDAFGHGSEIPILKLRERDNADIQMLADFVFKRVFEGYTQKQWGMAPDALKPSVTERVPVRISFDDRYFRDTYQALPKHGYTAMFQRMLDHKNITLTLNTEWQTLRHSIKGSKVVFTGAIDEYFDYAKGALPYRTLKFSTHGDSRVAGPTAQTNFPDNFDFTRVTNMSQLVGVSPRLSRVISEVPAAHSPGETEPYYPVPTDSAEAVFRQYEELAKPLAGQVWFAGRLADYKYYNMDQACGRALSLVEKELSKLCRREQRAAV